MPKHTPKTIDTTLNSNLPQDKRLDYLEKVEEDLRICLDVSEIKEKEFNETMKHVIKRAKQVIKGVLVFNDKDEDGWED